MEKQQEEENRIILAVVEGGGTSFVVAVAEVILDSDNKDNNDAKILFRSEIDSSHDNPMKTLEECSTFFIKHKPLVGGHYHSLGIATFGPVGLVKGNNTKTYGRILNSSPKKSWRNIDLITPLAEACRGSKNDNNLAIKIDTDVNAPAFAEYVLAKKDDNNISSVAYITVGTGIGVGLVIHGQPVHGRMHPEGGHVSVQPLPKDDFGGYSWGSKAPFKGRNTVEGLSSSVALTERLEKLTQKSNLQRSCLADLNDDHEIWDHAANAIANLCVTLLLVTSVEKIVIGGGIMKRSGLIEKIQNQTIKLINGYIELPTEDMSKLITLSSMGSDAGLIGAITLAKQAYEEQQEENKEKKTDKVSSEEESSSYNILSDFNVGVLHGIVIGFAAIFPILTVLQRRRK